MSTHDPLGRAPLALLIPAGIAALVLLLPLASLVAGTDWGLLEEQLHDEAVQQALLLSVLTATVAMLVCLLLGVPLAWLLARTQFRGQRLVRVLVAVPLVLPPVVGGVALMSAFGRTGILGEPLLDWTGLRLPFTTTGVVLAHVFVALPFVVIAVEGALRSANAGLDEAAATLGATRWFTFRRVTLPLALPGVAAGLMLGWARSMGEFGATITFAGNYQGTTQTMPSLIYQTMQTTPEAARGLGLLMLLVSVLVLFLLRHRWLGAAG